MPTAGVATITAFQVICRGKDKVRAIEIIVFGRKFVRSRFGLALACGFGCGIGTGGR
jgi:hypothetical protein